MPRDENGGKWACSPCVRGHRAMKCTHWDRFMLQVRKPGRPLTDCPHSNSKSRSCDCISKHERPQYRMIMIQRDSECLCRIDPTVAPWQPQLALQGPPQGPPQPPNQMLVGNNFPQHLMPPYVQPSFDHVSLNGAFSATVDHQELAIHQHQHHFPNDLPTFQRDLHETTIASQDELPVAIAKQPTPSCCSPRNESKDKADIQAAAPDEMSGLLRESPQTSLFHIPTNFATRERPMKPEQLAELTQSNPSYMQTIPAYAESGFVGVAAPPAETNDSPMGIPAATLHSCSCGNSCQCVACPAHPDNETMQDHVSELSQILDRDMRYGPFDDIADWPSSQANDFALMSGQRGDTVFPQLNEQQHGLEQLYENASYHEGNQWTPPMLGPQYNPYVPSPIPGPHPAHTATMIPSTGATSTDPALLQLNETFGSTNNTGHGDYFYYTYPIPDDEVPHQ